VLHISVYLTSISNVFVHYCYEMLIESFLYVINIVKL